MLSGRPAAPYRRGVAPGGGGATGRGGGGVGLARRPGDLRFRVVTGSGFGGSGFGGSGLGGSTAGFGGSGMAVTVGSDLLFVTPSTLPTPATTTSPAPPALTTRVLFFGGPTEFADRLAAWRAQGDLHGLEVRREVQR